MNKLVIALLLASLGLSACGQKGPLVQPQKEQSQTVSN